MTRDQVDEYYLTVAEVAELLRLNQQTVRNWIDQGSLPALRVGRRVRIKRSDLDRLLSEGYKAGAQASSAEAGPSAEDFWGGEAVGFAEVAEGGADGGAEPIRAGGGADGGAEPIRADGGAEPVRADGGAETDGEANGADPAARVGSSERTR